MFGNRYTSSALVIWSGSRPDTSKPRDANSSLRRSWNAPSNSSSGRSDARSSATIAASSRRNAPPRLVTIPASTSPASNSSARETEAWARLQLPARAGQPAVVRVVAEGLVDDAHVVGPRQHLLVSRLHVVRLVERVDDHLPVRRYHRGEVRTELHLVEVVRRRTASAAGRGSRASGSALGVEVDEHEATPALGAHRAQREVVGDAVEVVGVDDLEHPTVERVAPTVERTPERPVGDVPRARRPDGSRGGGTRSGAR